MVHERFLEGMKGFNTLVHILLALALVIACMMVIWDFSLKATSSFAAGSAASGFLHALDSLFILWTLSTLISAEINYVQTGQISVRVFVEVAIISVIREMIVRPLQAISDPAAAQFDSVHYALLLCALLVAGVVYRLVSDLPGEVKATDPNNSNSHP